jgi:catechol 2,3-dioxygenase-like lactoylglutathione lyase family enzyme
MHVILAVTDAQRSASFYEGVFGWERNPLVAQWSNYVELFQPEGGTLGLYEREGFAATAGAELAPANGHHNGAEIYVRVDDVAPLIERLEAAGAPPLSPLAPRVWGDDAAYFADPDGYVVAVAQNTQS